MRNGHALVTGRSGAGKSSLVNGLMRYTARAVMLDSQWEYDIEGGIEVYTLADAMDAVLGPFRKPERCIILARLGAPEEYTGLMRVVGRVQETEPHGPVVVVAEEAADYGTVRSLNSVMRQMYNKGRHWRVSMLSIVQSDTDYHRLARVNARWIISMHQQSLSSDYQKYFRSADVMALRGMDDKLPGGKTEWEVNNGVPVQGRHFLTAPDVDLYREWYETHGYILRPL